MVNMKKSVIKKRFLADKFADLANLFVGSMIISQIVSKDIDIVALFVGIIIVIALYFISYKIT